MFIHTQLLLFFKNILLFNYGVERQHVLHVPISEGLAHTHENADVTIKLSLTMGQWDYIVLSNHGPMGLYGSV